MNNFFLLFKSSNKQSKQRSRQNTQRTQTMTSMLSGASLDAVVAEAATARLEEAELRAKLAFIFKDPKAAESFEGKLAQRKLNMEKENKNASNDLDVLQKALEATQSSFMKDSLDSLITEQEKRRNEAATHLKVALQDYETFMEYKNSIQPTKKSCPPRTCLPEERTVTGCNEARRTSMEPSSTVPAEESKS